MEDIQLFEKSRLMGGYSVAVLDDWGQKVRRRFITASEKELYIEEFGEKMIKDSEFFNWKKKLKD